MKIGWRLGIAAVFTCLSGVLSLPTTSYARDYDVSDDVQAAMRLLDGKDYNGALTAAKKAVKANPSDPVALATRGNIYIELGDYGHALTDHDAVLAIVGDDPGALTNACYVRALANTELDRARDYCNRAVRAAIVRRSFFTAYDTRGFLDLRLGEFDAAIADYGKALEASPRTASSLYGRGVAKIRLGKVDDGQADITAAKKVQRDIAEYYARRGLTP